MSARSLMEIIQPGSVANGSIAEDFKVIGQALQHIGAESYAGVLDFFGIGTGLQYIAVVAAAYLFVLDRSNWRTNLLTTLLVPYIALNLPEFLLKIIRGEVGDWVAFIAVVINLFFPSHIPENSELPASLIVLMVTAPSVVVDVRYMLVGQLISIGIGFYLMNEHIRNAGGVRAAVNQNGLPITVGILLLFIAPVFALL